MSKFIRKISLLIKRWSTRIYVPGHKNVTLYHASQFYFNALQKGKIGPRAASVSFRFLTALFPLSIFIFSLIPYIPIDNLQNNMMNGLRNFFPEQIFLFLEDFLLDLVVKKHSVLLSLGFILSIYFASNATNALILGLNSSHHVTRKRKFIKQRLWSLGLLFIFFFLFILSFVITSGGQFLINYLYKHHFLSGDLSYWLLFGLKSLLSLGLFMFSISILYNIANTDKNRWRFFTAGALVSTLLIILLKECFGLYLSYFGKFDQIYGSIGAALAFLLFIYYLFILLIIGFELNVSLQTAYRKQNNKTTIN